MCAAFCFAKSSMCSACAVCPAGTYQPRVLLADANTTCTACPVGRFIADDAANPFEHDHETGWLSYLRTQRQQGYWRVWLYFVGSGKPAGDSYSNLTDHLHPPLAMVALASLPVAVFAPWPWNWFAGAMFIGLFLMQLPMTVKLVRRTRRLRYGVFAGMSFLRAFWRGVGMIIGTVTYATTGGKWKSG